MKRFKLSVHPIMIQGSVQEGGEAFFESFRIPFDEIENRDGKMFAEAFNFATQLLKSSFENVEVTGSSVIVSYGEEDEKEPLSVLNKKVICSYLESKGYRHNARSSILRM